jgi:hypothetical protein
VNTVWAVQIHPLALGYPPEVIALYASEDAARKHAHLDARLLEAVEMEVRTDPPTAPRRGGTTVSNWTEVDCDGGCGRRIAADRAAVKAGALALCTACHPGPLPVVPAEEGER